MYSPVKEGHNELFRTVCIIRSLGVEDIDTAAQMVAARWVSYERMPEPREIEDAWEASEDAYLEEHEGQWTRRPKPTRDERAIETILRISNVTIDKVVAASPLRQATLDTMTSGQFVKMLFPKNALLCVGRHQAHAWTGHIDSIVRRAGSFQLIVPNPMSSTKGQTKRGKWSQRCIENTGPRLYAVTEFDWGSLNQQAALISQVNNLFPGKLKMILHSGGKSLHAWWRVEGDATLADQIFDQAIQYGADPATRTVCQYVRMPQASRDNGNTQQVIFFDDK